MKIAQLNVWRCKCSKTKTKRWISFIISHKVTYVKCKRFAPQVGSNLIKNVALPLTCTYVCICKWRHTDAYLVGDTSCHTHICTCMHLCNFICVPDTAFCLTVAAVIYCLLIYLYCSYLYACVCASIVANGHKVTTLCIILMIVNLNLLYNSVNVINF